jgi:hypothetical protein
MGIEWFRDLSITILGLVTSVFLIFVSILAYRLFRLLKSTLLLVKATAKSANDTLSLIQEGLKPLVSLFAIFQGIREGCQGIFKMFKREEDEGGSNK